MKHADHVPERYGFVQGTGQTIPDNTSVNLDLERRKKGKQILTSPIISPVALGLTNYPTNWADIVDLEDSRKSNSVGLSNINLGDTAQQENSKAKAKDKNPIELTPSTNPKTQKRKRARKRAKRVIIQSELRRSVRISENPRTKHYTPKKDSKGDQPSQASQIAKTVQEAQILQALTDEEISANPLDEEKIQSINNYYGLTALGEPDQPDGDQAQVGLEPGDQALIDEAALDYDLDMDRAQVGDGEPVRFLISRWRIRKNQLKLNLRSSSQNRSSKKNSTWCRWLTRRRRAILTRVKQFWRA